MTGILFAICVAQTGTTFPTRSQLLEAMGAEPITGGVRYVPISASGSWQTLAIDDKLTGRVNPQTGEVRMLDIAKGECDRLDAKHTGPNRAETVDQACAITAAFVSRIRPTSELWHVKGTRTDLNVRGIPNRTAVFFSLSNLSGYAVDPQAIGLTTNVLQKSGILSRASLPYYVVTSTEDRIGQGRAREIAQAHVFTIVSWDRTGKRGGVIKMERFLTRDSRNRQDSVQHPARLVRAWRATFEKYGSYVTIDARDGSIINAERGIRPK